MPSNQEWRGCFAQLEKIIDQPINAAQQLQLQSYVGLLLKWNKTYNLIGPSTVSSILDRHIEDSAPLLPLLSHALPSSPHALLNIADIGSGAGFPGLVLALLSPPGMRFDLIESAGKKARFLQYVVNNLSLADNCSVFNQRAEQHQMHHKDEYHFVVSRAVGTLSLLAQLAQPLLIPGGSVLALKGERSEEEIEAFLSTPFSGSFETPKLLPVESIPGATIIRLRKVSRGTLSEQT
ncbi:MAG: 16S rRNA (guanine(527)-N(7))-methyltransferase RsmG [Magnetococcales bacterium]|nr:16S rRNA (guanine(527)-N(7))-methyltransferase RsmG [Magnetococcales bacterium]